MQNFTKGLTGWAIATGFILSIPLVAMQFTNEMNWDVTDFIVMGALVFGTGLAFELLTNKLGKNHRVAIGLILALALIILWIELAVGLFTTLGS